MKWAAWIASCGWIGYFPVFPGTIGSLIGLGLFILLKDLTALTYCSFLVLLFGLGVYSSTHAEPFFGQKDAGAIIIDEVHAMLVVPFLLFPSMAWWIAGFIIFRLFDIKKPPPIRSFEKLPGGWGVMMDDLIAALYTVGLLRLTEGMFRLGGIPIG